MPTVPLASRSVTWVVQLPPARDDSPSCGLLQAACALLGLSCVTLDVAVNVPPVLPRVDGAVVVHGRATLLRTACLDPDYRHGVFFTPETFTPSAYARGWGDLCLNPDVEPMRWQEALRALSGGKLFVCPDDDSKLFTGQVFDEARFHQLFERCSNAGVLTDEARVVVCPEREIDAEIRLFMVEGEVVSGSFFRPDSSPNIPDDLRAFARTAAARWQPHDVFVLDVARSERRYKIVEANCFNGSRFYTADVPALVERVSAYVSRLSESLSGLRAADFAESDRLCR